MADAPAPSADDGTCESSRHDGFCCDAVPMPAPSSRPPLDPGGFCPHGIGGGIGCSECERSEVWPITAASQALAIALEETIAELEADGGDVPTSAYEAMHAYHVALGQVDPRCQIGECA